MSLPWSDQRKREEYLPRPEEVSADAQRVRAMIKLFCGDGNLSVDEKKTLRAHWDMPDDDRIALPTNTPEQIAQIAHQATDVLARDALTDMDREHVRSVRNTMRAVLLLSDAHDVEIEGMEGAYDAIAQVPADSIVTDKAFLKKISEDQDGENVCIAHLLDLGVLSLVRISGMQDYSQVNRLRQELAIVGIALDVAKADRVEDEDLLPNQIRGQYGLIHEPELDLAKIFVDTQGEISNLDRSIITKLANKKITKLGQLIKYTAADLSKLSLSQAERARVISVLVLEGTVLKDALPNPFEPTA